MSALFQPNPVPEPIIAADMPARQQLQTIQAVRGVAALTVVAFHLTQFVDGKYGEALWFGLFERGFAGVDLFFVISGFVIVYTSQAYIGRPDTLRTYLTKRAIRVYPIYWLTIALMTLLMAISLWLRPDGVGKVIADRWPGLDTILLTPHHHALNIVSWSLSHELFFYLLFACLIVSRKLWVIPAFFLVGTLYMALTKQEYIDGQSTVWAYFWFNPLNAEFALGALIGYGFIHHKASKWEGISAALLGLVWLYSFGDTPNEFFGERLLHYGVASLLLLIAVLTYEYIRHPKLPQWIISTGDASYLIYLIHTPFLLPFTRLLTRAFPTYSAIGVPLACFALVIVVTYLSILTHRLVEKPLMRYLSARLLPKRKAGPTVA
ncbi:acyltransferase family protein [Fibrella aquatica]|uniref:acyltransferase family protein n=1 Tax=Fibrella aquatica TaxID=3242487 RepID=UPI0035206E8E